MSGRDEMADPDFAASTDSMGIHHSKTVNNSYCGGEFLLQMFE
jgi:hypothetical protein